MTPLITEERIQIFRSVLCVGRLDVYGTYFKDSGRCLVKKEPITATVIRSHLAGDVPLGVFLLIEDRVAFGVADFDSQDTQPVARFRDKLRQMNLIPYVERSKGKGFHVWVFFDASVSAKLARKALRSILASNGTQNVEVFPKQDVLAPGDYGNFINLPLFGEHVPNGRTVFVDDEFKPYPDQWAFLKSIQRVPECVLDAAIQQTGILELTPETANAAASNTAPSTEMTFGLKPCARRMLREGVSLNQRTACFRLAVQLRKAGLPLETALAALAAWATKNHPSDGKSIITEREIYLQADSAYKKHYAGCGCDDEAVRPFCDSKCELRARRRNDVGRRDPAGPPRESIPV